MLNRRCAGIGKWRSLLCLLMLAGIVHGTFPFAFGQSYDASRPPELSSYAGPAPLPQALHPQTANNYLIPEANWQDNGPVHFRPPSYPALSPADQGFGYKFRAMPGLRSAPDLLPKFRPDRNAGRFPSNWGREASHWQFGNGLPPPVFRPLKNGLKEEGQTGSGSGLHLGWRDYPPAGKQQDAYRPGWRSFRPLSAE